MVKTGRGKLPLYLTSCFLKKNRGGGTLGPPPALPLLVPLSPSSFKFFPLKDSLCFHCHSCELRGENPLWQRAEQLTRPGLQGVTCATGCHIFHNIHSRTGCKGLETDPVQWSVQFGWLKH